MKSDAIEIRPVYTPVDCRNVQLVQKAVWESGDRDLVPTGVLITSAKNGGVLLGAYTPDGPTETGGMVGFVFGWPGYDIGDHSKTAPKHCSHQLAVLAEYRQLGLGLRLKLAQREAVLAQGATEWVTWTFDPMQRVNAIFNLRRLGAISNTYLINAYGELDDALNIGLPTDRLQVDWWLRSPRVLDAISPEQPDHAWRLDELRILPVPEMGVPDRTGLADLKETAPLAVPLPDTADTPRTEKITRLSKWRYYLRSVLTTAFQHGYQITDCVALPDAGWHYILT